MGYDSATMMTIRRSDERGHAEHGWLDSRHTFSFGSYHDPAHMGFGPLRVLNEDRVAPGRGFGEHPHRDMEIISIVLEGALEHRDSLGSGSVLRPGDVQVMTAGTGVVHSEFNGSKDDPVHFLQIWIEPERSGAPPRYDEKRFEFGQDWVRVVSEDATEGSLAIGRDASMLRGRPAAGTSLSHPVAPGRRVWLQVIDGSVQTGGETLAAGDAAGFEEVDEVRLTAGAQGADILVIDLP